MQPAAAQETGETRTVVVSVHTQKGQQVNGLDASHFRAKVDGNSVQILSARYDTSPHRVVLLLDVSGSMTDNLGLERKVAETLLSQINPASPVALLSFATTVSNRLPFGTNRLVLRVALEGLEPPPMIKGAKSTRKTALLDALVEGLGMLDPPQPGDALCIISDGGDNASKVRESLAKRSAFSSGMRIFSILISDPLPIRGRTPEEASGLDLLASLSDHTGGTMVEFDQGNMDWLDGEWARKHPEKAQGFREDFFAPLEVMARDMNACYRLEIELAEKIQAPCKWKLQLVDPATGKPDRLLVLRYPARLYPAVPAGAGS